MTDSCFTYNAIATGPNFLSRKRELSQFISSIKEGRNIVIYEPPKTGKQSFIERGFSILKDYSFNFLVCRVDMTNIVHEADFFNALSQKFKNCFFKEELYSLPAADTEMNIGKEDWEALFALFEDIAKKQNIRVIIYFMEFQNILKFYDSEKIISLLEKKCASGNEVSYIFTGSSVNAMKYIFEYQKYFNKSVDRIAFIPLEEKAVSEMIRKVFLQIGKVVEQKQAENIYQLMKGHPWYIWQISSIAFNLTRGYLNDNIIAEAVKSVLALHEIRFREVIAGLSTYQISFLHAILDGNAKDSSMKTIVKYRLNSFANVHRLKEALAKKEVISFDENGTPYIIDPLFVLWLKRYYFKTTMD